MREQGTVLDAVGRAKHTLVGGRGAEAATITVHGECPGPDCGAISVVQVASTTTTITCSGCGSSFDV